MTTQYKIEITRIVEEDVLAIFTYIKNNSSITSAKKIVSGLQKKLSSLKSNPDRGNYPAELIWLGIKTYCEIHYHPYRIIYEVLNNKVIVHAIIDGRRDILSFLEQRLLHIFE